MFHFQRYFISLVFKATAYDAFLYWAIVISAYSPYIFVRHFMIHLINDVQRLRWIKLIWFMQIIYVIYIKQNKSLARVQTSYLTYILLLL